jgi:hypothetical protein
MYQHDQAGSSLLRRELWKVAESGGPGVSALLSQLGVALREQIVILHRRLLAIVRDDEVCRHRVGLAS